MQAISLTGLGTAGLNLDTFRGLFEGFLAGGVDKESAIAFAVNLADGAVDWTQVFPNAIGLAIEGPVERLILTCAFTVLWETVEKSIERRARLSVKRGSPLVERLTEAGALAVKRKMAALEAAEGDQE